MHFARRKLLTAALSGVASLAFGAPAFAQVAAQPFAQWVEAFRPRALAKGVSDATYSRVMNGLKPDTTVFTEIRSQPEFNQQLWQYLNRRVSDWRIQTGQERAKTYAPLLARIEKDFGVERAVILGLWGIESTFGDPVVKQNHSRPVFPALAALAWGEPRRRAYWETELINALRIVEKGWATPKDMVGSWAGAMGHTQWMPEVWLNVGLDYDGDGKVNPLDKPDDALGSSARYLVNRGKYRRGEHWGYEVRAGGHGSDETSRSYEAWQALGLSRADGQAFPNPKLTAKLWVPVAGGPAFLLGPNFYAVKTYNPSMNYTLAIVHLGDRVLGAGPFVQPFPNSERAPTLAEVQEMQTRLTAAGYDTGGTDGRVGNMTMLAARNFQQKAGLVPADGYLGLKLLAKLRGG
jgi:membrane-bound lytic murein transglycosylase B